MVGYKGFSRQGFQVAAAFDVDVAKTGTPIEGVPVYHLDELDAVVRREEIRLAIIAVPAESAQQVAERIGAAGIVGVLNFAPVMLNFHEHVHSVGVDLAIELEQLSFAVVNTQEKT